MFTASVFRLGTFDFAPQERGDFLPTGGTQNLIVRKLPGGAINVQALGPDEKNLSWSGIFIGSSGLGRARYLNGLRKSATLLNFQCGVYNYNVVIQSFEPDYKRQNHIPFNISLLIVEDLTQPITTFPQTSLYEALIQDMGNLLTLAGFILDPSISGTLALLNVSIANNPGLANSSFADIAPILQQTADVLGVVNGEIASIGAGLF